MAKSAMAKVTDELVFEEDVLQCRLTPEECKRKKRFFIEQTCWPEAVKIIQCERGSSFPLCMTERNNHMLCLKNARNDIEVKLAEEEQKRKQ